MLMASFRNPSFEERIGRAAEAKKKALEHLRSRPPVDPAILAERKAASARKEAADANRAAAREATKQAAVETAAAEAAAKAALPGPPTEAERKAARDARYAARKNRR
jgi:hypothetical protein